jgi:hypothetical protein
MKLTLADIDPHIGIGHHQVGVAGEPQSRDVKQTGQALIGNRHVDMFEMDRIAEIFGGTVELLMHGNGLGYGVQARHPMAACRTNPIVQGCNLRGGGHHFQQLDAVSEGIVDKNSADRHLSRRAAIFLLALILMYLPFGAVVLQIGA